jgi:mannose-6-phosphate isomerase-like protein (cupin superfamily)
MSESSTNGQGRRVAERASVEQVYQNVMRYKQMIPNWEAYPEAALPAHQRCLFRYTGTASSTDDKIPALIPDAPFSFATVYAEPGKGAPLHDHTEPELFFAVKGSWQIYFGDDGKEMVVLDELDAVLVPAGMQRGFRKVGLEAGLLLAIIARGDEPFPDYSEAVLDDLNKLQQPS